MHQLNVVNLPATTNFSLGKNEKVFVLKTCQRHLVVGYGLMIEKFPDTCFEFYVGIEAYQFLLEVICGLRSHLLAENEITAQFKTAYNDYACHSNKDSRLLHILEKLFKDTKEVRKKILNQVGQHSYASITRSLLLKKRSDGEALILGSGTLAFSLAKLLKKKYDITLTARNQVRQQEICSVFLLKSLEWSKKNIFSNFPIIINTVGTDEILFDHHFFKTWLTPHKVFVDLGAPSSIETDFTSNDGVIRLKDIFKESDQRSEAKQQQVAIAKEFITELAYRRCCLLARPSHEKEFKLVF